VKSLYRRDQLHEKEDLPSYFSSKAREFYHQFHSGSSDSNKNLHVSIPDHILDFLVAYLEDGKYFPDDYFMQNEKKELEFNE
jgi:hypothetical protein